METPVISLAEYQPHVVIPTSKAWHVYPLQYFRDFINESPVEEIPPDVLRTIVRSWLDNLPAVPEGGS